MPHYSQLMELASSLSPSVPCPPLSADSQHLLQRLLSVIAEWKTPPTGVQFGSHTLTALPEVLSLPPAQLQVITVHVAECLLCVYQQQGASVHSLGVAGLLQVLLRLRQSQDDALLITLWDMLASTFSASTPWLEVWTTLITTLENHQAAHGLPPELLQRLNTVTFDTKQTKAYLAEALHKRLLKLGATMPVVRSVTTLGAEIAAQTIISGTIANTKTESVEKPISEAEIRAFWSHYREEDYSDWPDKICGQLLKLSTEKIQAWQRLWLHASQAKGTNPTKIWQQKAKTLLQAVGAGFAKQAAAWLSLIVDDLPSDEKIGTNNTSLLKGFLWLCGIAGSPKVASSLGDMVRFGYAKLYGVGAHAPVLANAGLFALGQLGKEGVVQLIRLQGLVKYEAGLRLIEKALQQSATLLGIGRDDIEELAIPDFGLNAQGTRVFVFPEHRAELQLLRASTVQVNWFDNKEKLLKNLPAAAKKAESGLAKEVVQIEKELSECLSGQIRRLESLYLQERQWLLSDWQERYLTHPVLGWLGRRLIWQFLLPVVEGEPMQVYSALLLDDKLVATTGELLPVLPADTRVRLWHPVLAEADEVRRWRALLLEKQIVQPFKQAFREVYLLTPAERATNPLSHRFSGHILRQHQLAALCRERGWSYRLQGSWDGHNIPSRFLEKQQLAISFDLNLEQEGFESSPSGIFNFVTTDALHFYKPQRGAIPLEDVPPLLFSELLRDVDLFVGVCSIGINPNPQDMALNTLVGTYLRNSLVDELTASAQIRRDVLSSIISRLAIAPRCRIEGRYLVVKGELRTYHIHLGSGNILMSPNNQYLCIVPDKKAQSTDGIFIPFEGDPMLALILSKALLLANDQSITDSSIVAQIQHGL